MAPIPTRSQQADTTPQPGQSDQEMNATDEGFAQVKEFPSSTDAGEVTREVKKQICKECGHDHGFRPSFKDLKTSIDVIPLLLQKLREEMPT
jgi:hypothetical protein